MLHTVTDFFYVVAVTASIGLRSFPIMKSLHAHLTIKIISTKQQEINYVRTPITITVYPTTTTFQCIEEKLTDVTGKRLAINHLSRNVMFRPSSYRTLHTPISITSWQATYVQCNMAARSCNHCCSRKVISITHSEWVFVALGIHHSVKCGLSGSKIYIFCTFIAKTARVSKKSYWAYNVCFDLLYNFCLKHFSF